MEIFGFTILRPWWLIALPLLVVLGAIAARRARSAGSWERVLDPAMLSAMRRLGRIESGGRGGGWLPVIAALVIAIALTGPAKLRRDGLAYRNLDGIVLVVDMSRRTVESDRFGTAITAARLVAHGAGTRQVGLVVFAGDAYVASALTTDARAVGGTLALLDSDTMPEDGSRADLGLARARQMLSEAEIRFGDIVLVTDTETAARADVARQIGAARAANATVSLIHSDADAQASPAALGVDMLTTASDPGPVVEALADATVRRIGEAGYSVILWQDFGRYLLWFAVLPVLLLFRGWGRS